MPPSLLIIVHDKKYSFPPHHNQTTPPKNLPNLCAQQKKGGEGVVKYGIGEGIVGPPNFSPRFSPQIFISIQFIFPLPPFKTGCCYAPNPNPIIIHNSPPSFAAAKMPRKCAIAQRGGNNPLLVGKGKGGKEHNSKSPSFLYYCSIWRNQPCRKQG